METLSIKMTKKQKRALQKMADDMDKDISGVLQTGFALLQVAIRESKEGNDLAVTKDNEIIKEIVGVW